MTEPWPSALRVPGGAQCGTAVEAWCEHRQGPRGSAARRRSYCCPGQPADAHQGNHHHGNRGRRLLGVWRGLLRPGTHPGHRPGVRGRPGAADPGVRHGPAGAAAAPGECHRAGHAPQGVRHGPAGAAGAPGGCHQAGHARRGARAAPAELDRGAGAGTSSGAGAGTAALVPAHGSRRVSRSERTCGAPQRVPPMFKSKPCVSGA